MDLGEMTGSWVLWPHLSLVHRWTHNLMTLLRDWRKWAIDPSWRKNVTWRVYFVFCPLLSLCHQVRIFARFILSPWVQSSRSNWAWIDPSQTMSQTMSFLPQSGYLSCFVSQGKPNRDIGTKSGVVTMIIQQCGPEALGSVCRRNLENYGGDD